MKFRKKPVVIDAKQYTGDNWRDMLEFLGETNGHWDNSGNESVIVVYTLEGNHIANHGDYIIKGVKGEFYPCKPDIFEMTYEKVEEE
jgi:hypothetical protein